jgi:hypothetical protein
MKHTWEHSEIVRAYHSKFIILKGLHWGLKALKHTCNIWISYINELGHFKQKYMQR